MRLSLDEDESLTWDILMEVFGENLFPESVWDEKDVEFIELARFAPHIVVDDTMKAKKSPKGDLGLAFNLT